MAYKQLLTTDCHYIHWKGHIEVKKSMSKKFWFAYPFRALCTVGFWCQTIHKKFLRRFDTIFGLKMMMKSGLEKIILKFHDGLQSCCCPVQKNLPRKAELAWQVSRYLWRPPWNFKIIFSRPLFTIIFKPKMVLNLHKNFLCNVWHQTPTVLSDQIWNLESRIYEF